MKVLQVCAYAAPYEGNFINSLKILAQALSQKSTEQIYAFPEPAKGIPWVKELAENSKVYWLPLAKARIKPATYRKLEQIFQENPDIVIAHSHFELYDVPVELTAPENVKVFWHLHDALEMYSGFKNRLVHKVQYGLMHGRADLLSASEKHMAYVIRKGFPRSQGCYVPNGLDTDRIRMVNKPLSERQYDFLIFAWDYRRKGADICADAIRRYKLPYSVAAVAESFPEELPENMKEVKPVKDINALYSDAKCFLHISRAEGLSYALLEALYAGLPVICSDIPENHFAGKFPTAIMVKKENPDAVAAAMQSLMQEPGKYDRYAAQTRKMIEKEYSVSSWVDNILEYYEI